MAIPDRIPHMTSTDSNISVEIILILSSWIEKSLPWTDKLSEDRREPGR
jgi:hypothetical protein